MSRKHGPWILYVMAGEGGTDLMHSNTKYGSVEADTAGVLAVSTNRFRMGIYSACGETEPIAHGNGGPLERDDGRPKVVFMESERRESAEKRLRIQ